MTLPSALPPVRFVIFDFDGTLADTTAGFTAAVQEAADRFGFRRITDEEARMLRGWRSRDTLGFLGIPLWQVPRIATHMRRLAAERVKEIALFPAAAATLRRLHGADIRLAVVSSNAEATIRTVLGADAALIDAFDCGASLFGKSAKFRRLVARSGVPPAQVMAVGDEDRDIEAAHDAGIRAGAALWGFGSPAFLRGLAPDACFASLVEVADALAGPVGVLP